MTEGRDEQTWNTTHSSLHLTELLFLSILTGSIFHLYAAQILPSTVDSRHSACVGNGGSYVQMDANCTSGQVIAVTSVKVGAKPNELSCPKIVNSSTIFDPGTCCQPNQTNDCIIDYPISTLRSFCSGQTQCQSSLAERMSFNDTSCNTTVYGTKTSYMSLEYQCIEGSRVSEMCTAVSVSTTSFIYLWNRNYGTAPPLNNTIPASDTLCACSVETESCAASIFVYSVHTDLSQINGTCHQELKFTDEAGASAFNLSCTSYEVGHVFTISSNYLHVKFENTLGHNDGRFWLGFQASDSSSRIHLNCPAVNRSYCNYSSTTEKQFISTFESVSISIVPTTATLKETNATDITSVAEITFPATGLNNIQSSSVSTVVAGSEKRNSGLNKWMILLIVLAAVLLFILLIIVVVCLVCCKSETQRRKRVITLKRRDVETAERPKSTSKCDEQGSSIGSATDLQQKLAQEYCKDPECTTSNSSNCPNALATSAMYQNHRLTPLENTTPVDESLDLPMSNSKRSSKSRNSLDRKAEKERTRQFLTSDLPDAYKQNERKKSRRKKKRAEQVSPEEKINYPTLRPPGQYSSGYIRAKIVIEGDFPLSAPENGRSRGLSRKKKKKHNRVKAFELPPASGMLRYDDIYSKSSTMSLKENPDPQKVGGIPIKSKVAPEMINQQDNDTDLQKKHNRVKDFELHPTSGMLINDDISSKGSKRSLKENPESQKVGGHPLKSKVAPEMIKQQGTDNEINNPDHSNTHDIDTQESSDVEINNRNYSDVDERHATGITERQQSDVETSYGNHSFVHDRKVPGSTERQRHLLEIYNVNDSDVHD